MNCYYYLYNKKSLRNTTIKLKSGRKRGITNFMKKELATLLDLTKTNTCGTFQWDIVPMAMYNVGYKTKDQDAYKKELGRLWQTNKPASSSFWVIILVTTIIFLFLLFYFASHHCILRQIIVYLIFIWKCSNILMNYIPPCILS